MFLIFFVIGISAALDRALTALREKRREEACGGVLHRAADEYDRTRACRHLSIG